ncbi:MAG TPA: aminomethyl-transferring glycine dehydrogenase subunit GcvPA [Candidatus Nitrosotenuis sp.]
MNYIPTTQKDRDKMLKQIGVNSINDLVKEFRPLLKASLNLPKPLSEFEIRQHMQALASKNKILKYFVGAGSYNHYIPSALNHLLMRGEFSTGYTPYQPEISQGTLQAMYEFQSFMCILTGMDVANASLYDGASALAEAALLSASYNGRNRIFVKEGLHPQYLQVLRTYCDAANLEITNEIDDKTSCVIAQNPDFYGNVEDLTQLSDIAHKAGALFVVCVVEPTSLAIIRAPADYGADIVVGEGQSFGIPINFGGPYLGFMAVKDFLLKKIPGRICGMTTDSNGNKGFVLTFQAREQHIRRERATSNITTNQGLMALASTIYLALMGRNGLRTVARLSYGRAHLLQEKLEGLGFKTMNSKPFYNEFLVKTPKPAENILSALFENGMHGGLKIAQDRLLICCTEMNTIADIERFASVVSES